jgi:hypothetical protein
VFEATVLKGRVVRTYVRGHLAYSYAPAPVTRNSRMSASSARSDLDFQNRLMRDRLRASHMRIGAGEHGDAPHGLSPVEDLSDSTENSDSSEESSDDDSSGDDYYHDTSVGVLSSTPAGRVLTRDSFSCVP